MRKLSEYEKPPQIAPNHTHAAQTDSPAVPGGHGPQGAEHGSSVKRHVRTSCVQGRPSAPHPRAQGMIFGPNHKKPTAPMAPTPSQKRCSPLKLKKRTKAYTGFGILQKIWVQIQAPPLILLGGMRQVSSLHTCTDFSSVKWGFNNFICLNCLEN